MVAHPQPPQMRKTLIPCPNNGLCGSQKHFQSSEVYRFCASQAKRSSKEGIVAPPVSSKSSGKGKKAPVTAPQQIQGLVQGIHGLHDYQEKMVADIMAELKVEDRAQGVAACGMGKTVMAQELILQHWEANGKPTEPYIFVTDKIALTNQSREAFDENGVLGKHEALTVHSASQDLIQSPSRKNGQATPAEADIETISRYMDHAKTDRPRIIFVTYDSAHKVAKAQAERGKKSPMVVLDEAHRLASGVFDFKVEAPEEGAENQDEEVTSTGRLPRVFFNSTPGGLQADARVFFTATPTFVDPFSRSETTGPKDTIAGESVDEAVLARRAIVEDDQDTNSPFSSIQLRQTDKKVFGRVVRQYTQVDAEKMKALTPVDQVVVRVRTKIPSGYRNPNPGEPVVVLADGSPVADTEDPFAMKTTTYSAIRSMASTYLEFEDSHNSLVFLSTTDEVDSFEKNWFSVIKAEIGPEGFKMSESEAWDVVNNSENHTSEEVKRAKGRLVITFANVTSAHSKSDPSKIQEAYSYFDEEKNPCTCGNGENGGWCACKRVVANCNLFGTGIDIKAIDTVIQMNHTLLNDSNVAQTMGRAGRKKDGKKSARVVIPMVTADVDEPNRQEDLLNSLHLRRGLDKWSRINRNAAKAAFAGHRLDPIDPHEVHIAGEGKATMTDTIHRLPTSRPYVSAIISTGISVITSKAQEIAADQGLVWNSLTKPQRNEKIKEAAHHFRTTFFGNTQAQFCARVVAHSDLIDKPDALSTHKALIENLRSRHDSIDRDALSPDEKAVLGSYGYWQADASLDWKPVEGRVAQSSAAVRDGKMEAWLVQHPDLIDEMASQLNLSKEFTDNWTNNSTFQKRVIGRKKLLAKQKARADAAAI